MNQRQTLYTKYPDLLPINPDSDLEELIAGFDQLCSKQPPPELTNLSLAQSFEARQVESLPQPLAWQTGADGLFHPASSYPRRYRYRSSFRRGGIFVTLGLLVLGSFILLATNSKHPTSRVVEIQPPCVNSHTTPIKQAANAYAAGCLVFAVQNPQVDADRITINYTISGMSSLNYVPMGVRLTDEQGREIKHLGSVVNKTPDLPVQAYNGKALRLDNPNLFYGDEDAPVAPPKPAYPRFNSSGEEWFDASSLAGLAKGSVLRLHLEVEGLENQGRDQTFPSLSNPFSFDFVVNPSNDGSRVVVLNQHDTYNGATATLEKVAVMPNSTRLYLRGIDSNLDYELRAGSIYLDSRGMASQNIDGLNQLVTTTDGLTVITIKAVMLNITGDWTLIIKSKQLYKSQPTQGPWLFRFSLPTVSSPSATVETVVPSPPPTLVGKK